MHGMGRYKSLEERPDDRGHGTPNPQAQFVRSSAGLLAAQMTRFSYYIDGRLFEWVMSVSMVLLSIEIFIWPDTLRASAFQWVVQVMHVDFVGVVLLIAGVFRVSALVANGSSMVIGPRVRAVGALIGAAIWVQFGMALVKLSVDQNFASPGIPFWFMFTLAELRITYRAVLDVRTAR